MANWYIPAPGAIERKYVAEHGIMEYSRRLAIANQKADDLLAAGYWEEAVVMRPQFQTMVMTLVDTTKAEALSGHKWATIFYKLAS